jgi:hypothetical protein
MKRCISKSLAPMLALAIGLTALSGSALAQFSMRPFPPSTLRGAMTVTQPPELVMNGKGERLSPGARIHGANNMLVMSGSIVGQNLLVNFVRESNGLVHEVWILTEDEAKQALPTGGLTLVK